MGLITIDDLFGGPWGIVANRRGEIESTPYGSFDQVYEEEVKRNLLPVAEVAAPLGCHESTARKWLRGVPTGTFLDSDAIRGG